MEYTDENADRKRKIRIIAITCVLAVVVLGIGAWVTISAISSIGSGQNTVANTANNNTNTSTVAKTEETTPTNNTKSSSTSTKKSDATEEAKNSTTENSAAEQKSTASASSVTSSSTSADIPSTGPADFIPTALLMGVATYLVLLNRNFAHRKI